MPNLRSKIVPAPTGPPTMSFSEMIQRYEGYYVEPNVRRPWCIGGSRLGQHDPDDYLVHVAARAGLSKYNRQNGMRMKVRKIVRVNLRRETGSVYFITFQATDKKFYETTVEYQFEKNRRRRKMKVRDVRPAVHYPGPES